MDNFITEYASEQISLLINTNVCCINWLGPFYDVCDIVNKKLTEFNLKCKTHMINGHKVKKIYKINCRHCMEQPRHFQLNEKSQKSILFHLKKFDLDVQRDALAGSFFKPVRLMPVLPANRFTIVPFRQATFDNVLFKKTVEHSSEVNSFEKTILKKIGCNRIVVMNGDASLKKSTVIPICIVEQSVADKKYCKILCVESDNLSAINNSTEAANHFKERIGCKVGFQVYLQSRVCDNTNIIYTTAVFFLRVLMGQDSKESFQNITHIVLSDVHLHQAYKDIFLKELKNMLPHHPRVKIIILTNTGDNGNILSYFNEGEELQLNANLYETKLLHLEDIMELMQKNQLQSKPINTNPLIKTHDVISRDCADMALEYYKASGSETALKKFLYLVRSEKVSINYAHSKEGYTALIEAVKRNNLSHVHWLLTFENANPYYEDKSKVNALEYTIATNNTVCFNALIDNITRREHELKTPPINVDLIVNLIQLIKSKWTPGNILVFLPTFEDLLRLKYIILKMQFIGKLSQAIEIHLLHLNMQHEQLQQLISSSIEEKIILATDMAESLEYLNDITYVIDTGQDCKEIYLSQFKCNELVLEWTSRESLQRRAAIAGRFTAGYCFSLVPRNIVSRLQLRCTPELQYIPMNRVALTIKFLNPCIMVSEYFQDTIFQPPSQHVVDSVDFLKDIEVLDSREEITWLGCRLVDVPISLEHGKSVVFSILLKCLDPVLTIISFLAYSDTEKMTKFKHSIYNFSETNSIRPSEGSFSDHLELLRLYQVWQDENNSKTTCDTLSDEKTFILNGILESVCEIRTNLVGALRSSQLIHNIGSLSMHSINSKANNWAAIKASLAGGFYPKFCIKEQTENSLNAIIPKVLIHTNSILHHSKLSEVESLPSDWIFYCSETKSMSVNSISICTLINQASVALFAGKMEMHAKNIIFGNDHTGFYINENMWLKTDQKSALILYKLRQIIYLTFVEYLQTCANIEKWKKTPRSAEVPSIFDLIGKLLLEEDVSTGFAQPNRVGNRPKASANKCIPDLFKLNALSQLNFKQKEVVSVLLCKNGNYLEKEFFLVNIFDNNQIFKKLLNQPIIDLSKNSRFKTIYDIYSCKKLTYLMVCDCSRKRITTIGLVTRNNDTVLLRFRFQVNIPVHEVIISCAALKCSLPSFHPNCNPQKLENTVGELILELI